MRCQMGEEMRGGKKETKQLNQWLFGRVLGRVWKEYCKLHPYKALCNEGVARLESLYDRGPLVLQSKY